MTQKQIDLLTVVNQELENMKGFDIELEHARADELLCEVLKSFGCNKTVELFIDLQKWYA